MLAMAGGVVLGVLLLRAKWRRDGRKDAENNAMRGALGELIDQQADRQEAERKVREASPDERKKLMEKWTR